MSMFIEVNDVEKGCPVIINLDEVIEIAPLRTGGCDLFFADSAAVGGKRAMKVKDNYTLFKQFVMQTVSTEDIAKVISRTKQEKKEKHPVNMDDLEIPKL